MPSINMNSVASNGVVSKPYIIGIVGGTNSGKTTVCKKIIREVQNKDYGALF